MNSNKSKYCIVGNNIVIETTTTEVIANASLNKVLFNPDAKRDGIRVEDIPKPIHSLSSQHVHYYDSNSLLHKATNLGSRISFKASARLIDDKWCPDFYPEGGSSLYSWIYEAKTTKAKFVLIETYYRSRPNMLIDSARLIYAEQDSENAGIVHTFAPPFPNTYENANLCLGTLKEGESVPLNFERPQESSKRLMENGWNQDLYRHAPYFVGPSDDLVFKYPIRPKLYKSTMRDHGFYRLTDQTDTDIVTGLLNPKLINL